ncbi:RloB family protein [Pseudomonas frederiksbergensis]|uniref:RloB domain-containing protein n=1 Tax=Pseudomonas frederiksbergensis TaxID=104087 RepID=A0A6L5C125_9PSED|nr:RloB family protein [Pseudomonas frederiksbergensis]KAF2393164.1 hypothetical protein FX983_01125 [Pseudomonas frederiksbergensis]
MPKPRSKKVRSLPNVFHIYCEGEKTEPYYINKYIQDLDQTDRKRVIQIEPTKKNTPVQLVEEAIKRKNSASCPEGDIFWVVFDRESVAKYSEELHDEAYDKAHASNIKIALSTVCFEQWILLHFVASTAPYASYDDLIKRSPLTREFKKISKKDYEKGHLDTYSYLKSRIQPARERATKVNATVKAAAANGRTRPHHLNPYTDLPLLLDAIDSFQ